MLQRSVALCAQNRALSEDIHTLILKIEELDYTLAGYTTQFKPPPGWTCG
jgi:hypothetical protein